MPTLLAPPQFHWTPQPAAQAEVDALVAAFLDRHAFARTLRDRLLAEAGVRLGDLVESVSTASGDGAEPLLEAGFLDDGNGFVHPGGEFPRIVIGAPSEALAFRVDSVDDFTAAHGLDATPAGAPGTRMRTLTVPGGGADLVAVERHGWAGSGFPDDAPGEAAAAARWAAAFAGRPREGDDATLLAAVEQLAADALAELSRDRVCDLFFAAERGFWTSRNAAARAQLARQRRLGIGWANHDHHTYRSSRERFGRMVALFEKLGLACRESFTPGPDAGWGAQVMEQPVTRIVVFADVDMTPEELRQDFAHRGLPPRDAGEPLGTVGLWCGLHGDSLLQAGMHHLECTFSFDALREQLAREAGVEMMPAFTSFDHLKQQFTRAEKWPVDAGRLDALLRAGRIDGVLAERFAAEGALGSHLENLERNDGFKGFNQKGVTDIIGRTDARRG